MTPKDVLRQIVHTSDFIVRMYTSDLTDAELLVRSVPGANHIAWQLGHIVVGAGHMLKSIGRAEPAIPESFAATYDSAGAASDDPTRFATKAEYLALLDQAKAAVLAAIDETPDATLDDPGPESMREYAPTVGSVLMIMGSHPLMHAGQFVPIRRKLGKAPLF